jgi:hypothetical protein
MDAGGGGNTPSSQEDLDPVVMDGPVLVSCASQSDTGTGRRGLRARRRFRVGVRFQPARDFLFTTREETLVAVRTAVELATQLNA